MSDSQTVQRLMVEIANWSDATFGNNRNALPMIYHLKKEVNELAEAIEDFNDREVKLDYGKKYKKVVMEYADCLMLILDSATHFGLTAEMLVEAVKQKLAINMMREWGKT